jgi:glutaminyl-tRNA synthetase
MEMKPPEKTPSLDFIRAIVAEDLAIGKNDGRVATRFPPEPNGYLHIGHAKSICLNFEIAAENNGTCNLRFDDTNPLKEEEEYVKAIVRDVHWLGFDWEDRLFYASDYFEQFYQYAEQLILDGKAYVDDLNAEEIREYRGSLTKPGRESPSRNRPVEESLDLFRRMRAGEFENGQYLLRAKVDMGSPNLNMRDPAIFRIRHATHHRTGDKWCIYPMYDWAHGLSDSIEGITHSLCTLEFQDHRPLYDWFLDELRVKMHPKQIEFARLNLTYTIMSKRKLLLLVQEGHVNGWDDPRMPTLVGLRRRGYTPKAIVDFCDRIGMAKKDAMIDVALLEFSVRQHLNRKAPRAMAVLRPLKVVIENYPDEGVDDLEIPVNPEDPTLGVRQVPFTQEIYIEQDDFMEDPPRKFFRLGPGREVRLRGGYFVKCNDVVRDRDGRVVELRCTFDPETRSGKAPDGRKVRGTLHWVSAAHSIPVEVRLYDRLFTTENPAEAEDFRECLNPDSLEVLTDCRIEESAADARPESRFQFERLGYFCVDPDSEPGQLVFNRTVTLRDSWAKIRGKK